MSKLQRGASRRDTPAKNLPRPERPRGASSQPSSSAEKLYSWWQHHQHVARDSLLRMRASPVATLLMVGVLAVALALPASLYLVLDNLKLLTRDWEGNAQISLFLNMTVTPEAQQKLDMKIASRGDVARTQLITPEEALEEFRRLSGFGEVLDSMASNPLPPVIVVYPVDTSLEAAEALREELAGWPEVEIAQLDAEWVQRWHSLLALGQRLVAALAAVLLVSVLLVVINSIRLAIENRRDEIIIIKLVGATDAFVRRPFLYTGLWYGVAGGILAVILVQALVWLVNGPATQLAALYQAEFSLSGLGLGRSLLLVLLAGFLGWLGAWLAVYRHLRQIEPR